MTTDDDEYVVVHVTKEHRFWTGKGWTLELDKAKTYTTYGDAMRIVWRGLLGPEEGRLTAVPKGEIKIHLGRKT